MKSVGVEVQVKKMDLSVRKLLLIYNIRGGTRNFNVRLMVPLHKIVNAEVLGYSRLLVTKITLQVSHLQNGVPGARIVDNSSKVNNSP